MSRHIGIRIRDAERNRDHSYSITVLLPRDAVRVDLQSRVQPTYSQNRVLMPPAEASFMNYPRYVKYASRQ